MVGTWGDDVRQLTPNVSVFTGPKNGMYPSGNSLVVQGAGETVIIDPSVTVAERGGVGLPVDGVINSHGHEDHLAGNCAFPDARIEIHDADLLVTRGLEHLMGVTRHTVEGTPALAELYLETFHYAPRPDATGFSDGKVWDLGGTRVEAVHLPGHTAGHSGFRIDGGVFFMSDIDLTGFGPYYGDVFATLDQFEASIETVRHEEADFYVTFHHKGVIEGREALLALLDKFAAVIPRRHAAMLDFLIEPHSINEMAARRFVYRPDDVVLIAEHVEIRTAELHTDRMLDRGEVEQLEDGRFRAL